MFNHGVPIAHLIAWAWLARKHIPCALDGRHCLSSSLFAIRSLIILPDTLITNLAAILYSCQVAEVAVSEHILLVVAQPIVDEHKVFLSVSKMRSHTLQSTTLAD